LSVKLEEDVQTYLSVA